MDRRLHHLSRHFVIHSSDEINCNLKNFGFFKSTTLFNLQWKEKDARKLLFCFPTVLHRWYISPENACKGLKMKRSYFAAKILWFSAWLTSSSLASGMSCLISDKQSFILRRLFRSISGFRGDLVKNEMKMPSSEKTNMSGWHCHTKMN